MGGGGGCRGKWRGGTGRVQCGGGISMPREAGRVGGQEGVGQWGGAAEGDREGGQEGGGIGYVGPGWT